MEIAILGVGNIGKLLAHSLAKKSSPPFITLLFHRPDLMEEYRKAGKSIEVISNGISEKQSSFRTEIITDHDDSTALQNQIQNLIVSTKTTHTVTALARIKKRLNRSSTVLFAQNGMGLIEEVTQHIFPNVETRPAYLASVLTHGVYARSPFSSEHVGFGTMAIGSVPTAQPWESNMNGDLWTTFARLARANRKYANLMCERGCANRTTTGANREACRQCHDQSSESSQVFRLLPELKSLANPNHLFSAQRLEVFVRNVAEKTALNTSSMLQDVKAGRDTEIDYINGFIVNKGKQLNISCPYNRKIVQMVKDKTLITEDQIESFFPSKNHGE